MPTASSPTRTSSSIRAPTASNWRRSRRRSRAWRSWRRAWSKSPKIITVQTLTGPVADRRWAELSRLRLRAGHGDGTAPLTDQHIPTLDQYLAAAKGRVMIVFDVKDGSQRDTFRQIERARMADQAIFFYECVDRTLADAIAPFRDRVTTIPIMFGRDGPLAPAARRCPSNPAGWAHVKWNDPAWLRQTAAMQDRTAIRLWTATMFPADNAGFDDARALVDPDAVWGAQRTAGAGMIMTNEPEALIAYRVRTR